MHGVEALLARHFPGMSVEAISAELAASPAPGAITVSRAALTYLTQHGGDIATAALAQYDPAQGATEGASIEYRTLREIIPSALTVQETAELLGVSRSRIFHRITDGALYAFTIGRRRMIPRWQFLDTSVIAGLAAVVPPSRPRRTPSPSQPS